MSKKVRVTKTDFYKFLKKVGPVIGQNYEDPLWWSAAADIAEETNRLWLPDHIREVGQKLTNKVPLWFCRIISNGCAPVSFSFAQMRNDLSYGWRYCEEVGPILYRSKPGHLLPGPIVRGLFLLKTPRIYEDFFWKLGHK